MIFGCSQLRQTEICVTVVLLPSFYHSVPWSLIAVNIGSLLFFAKIRLSTEPMHKKRFHFNEHNESEGLYFNLCHVISVTDVIKF